MQTNNLARVGVTVVAGLAAWELGQVAATYLVLGFFGGSTSLGFTRGDGFGQVETLALLVVRLGIAALVAVPVVLVLSRLLWREPSR